MLHQNFDVSKHGNRGVSPQRDACESMNVTDALQFSPGILMTDHINIKPNLKELEHQSLSNKILTQKS